MVATTQRQCINLASGKLVRASTDEETWTNVDIAPLPGVDQTVDLFQYPWPLPSETFDYAYAGHVVEHIPHYIQRAATTMTVQDPQTNVWGEEWTAEADAGWCQKLWSLPDGFFAWFAEAWRILKPDGVLECEVPWGWSSGGAQDPGHTRLILPQTLSYLTVQASPTFDYLLPFRWDCTGYQLGVDPEYQHLPLPEIERLANRLLNVVHTLRFSLKKVLLAA